MYKNDRRLFDVIRKPIVTKEKGVLKKDAERTLCFEVAPGANKTQIRNAVQSLFKVKVEDVRTTTTAGKLRRRGKFAGYQVGLEEGVREVARRPGNTRRSRRWLFVPRRI